MNPNDEQDVKTPTLDPSASQAENNAPPAESTAPPTPEAPKPDDKPGFREALAEEIVKGAFEEPAQAAPAAPEKAEPVATTPAPAPVAKPEPDPYDDPDDPSIDEIDPKFTKIRGGFEKFRTKLRDARRDGQFGRLMAETARTAGIKPDQLAWWVHLGARVSQGDPGAIAEMHAFTQRLGGKPPAAAAPAPAAPAVDPVNALADRVYQEHFADEVKNLEITEEAARRLSRKQAERMAPAAPAAPDPALSQPAPQPRPQQDPLVHAAVTELNALDAQYAASVPSFEDVRKEALGIIEAERAKNGPIPPMRWPVRYAEVIRQVQAKRAAAAAPPRVRTQDGIRPSTGSAPVSKDRSEHLNRIADAMVAGDPSLLP